MACKHRNCSITTWYLQPWTYTVEDGEIGLEGYAGEADRVRRIRMVCDDCGMDKCYSEPRLPQWLQEYKNQRLEVIRDA